jgi:hypothetical protein
MLKIDRLDPVKQNVVPLPLRLFVAFGAVLLASFVAWHIWHMIFNADMPILVIGAVGGITAATTLRYLKIRDVG